MKISLVVGISFFYFNHVPKIHLLPASWWLCPFFPAGAANGTGKNKAILPPGWCAGSAGRALCGFRAAGLPGRL